MSSAHVDCLACACLIRAQEPSCPFCGAGQRHVSAASTRLSLGLTLGVGLAVISCGDDEGGTAGDTMAVTAGDTVGNTIDAADTLDGPEAEADAVTYAGPDSWDSSDEGPGPGSTVGSTTIEDDSQEADAVTYAGPDESTTIGDASTTSGTTTDTETQGTTDGGCAPITEDPAAIGTDCQAAADCPDGYTCQPFEGFAFQMTCQVLCEQTCQCPMGLTCNETVDKTGVPWFQCG